MSILRFVNKKIVLNKRDFFLLFFILKDAITNLIVYKLVISIFLTQIIICHISKFYCLIS